MSLPAIDKQAVAIVAKGLGHLLDQMVFIGGAAIEFYIDDPAADEVRTTGDIDLTVEITTYGEYNRLLNELSQLGFKQSAESTNMSRVYYKGIAVDIMPSEDTPIGKTNSWYRPGFAHLKKNEVENLIIQLLELPYFIATKFEAFNNRGGDPRVSHDFEDIIYTIDNCTTIVNEIIAADKTVREFIELQLKKIIEDKYHEEILSAHLHPNSRDIRLPIVIEKIKQIIS